MTLNHNTRFFNRLSGRMLLFVVVPTFLILATVITFQAYNHFNSLLNREKLNIEQMAQQVADATQLLNERAINVAKTMAKAQEAGLFGNRDKSSQFARSILQSYPDFIGAYIGYEENADQSDIAFSNSSSFVMNPGIADKNGRFLPHWQRNIGNPNELSLSPLTAMQDSQYYSEPKAIFQAQGKAFAAISEPYINQGQMIVEHTYPIVIHGEFQGITGVNIALSELERFLNRERSEGLDIFLVSKQRKFIASTVHSYQLKAQPVDATKYNRIFSPFIDISHSKTATVITSSDQKSVHIYASAKVATSQWTVIVRAPEDRVTAPILVEVTTTFFVFLIGMTGVAIVISMFARATSNRINQAIVIANQVADGDLSADLSDQLERKDEIGQMFRSFQRFIHSGREINHICSSIAEGDFSSRITERSDKDTLAKSINSLTEKREAAETHLTEQVSLNSLLKDFSIMMRGKNSIEELGDEVNLFLISQLSVPMVGIYIMNGDSLNRVAGIGYSDDAPTSYKSNDTLHKSLVKTNKRHSLKNLDDHYAIPLNGGELKIAELHYFPLTVNNNNVGLLEIGTVSPLIEQDFQWLDTVVDDLAIGVQLTRNIELQQITERKVSEQLELTRQILNTIPNPVYYRAPDGRYKGVNNSFLSFIGKTSKQVMHTHPRELFDDQVYQLLMQCHDKLLDEQGCIDFEIHINNTEHEPRIMAIYEASFTNSSKEVQGIVGVMIDITERTAMEQELRNSKEMADEASKAKGEFLANMSHEIRTPMNAIIGMAHMALSSDLSAQQRNYVSKIDTAAKSLLGIINDILDFSKIEAGKMTVEMTDFQLDDVMDNLANVIALKAQEKNLEFLYDIEPQIPIGIVGDPLRLGQVLINLCGNAIKFTEQGQIVVSVHQQSLTDENVIIQFDVQDSGIGLSQSQQEKLFDSFAQADGSITRKYGGTGLGLSISKHLVELMGGDIWLSSQPDNGSTFSFTINCGLQTDRVARHYQPADSFNNKRVLVVDDNSIAREIMCSLLTNMHFRVSLVASGPEALAEIAEATQDPFEIIFMDWYMPGPNGLDVINQIRQQNLQPVPKMILVTAYGREDVMTEAEGSCLDGLIIKPVNPSSVFDAIMDAFGIEEARNKTSHSLRRTSITESAQLQEANILLVEDNEINQEVAMGILEPLGATMQVTNNGQEALDYLEKHTPDLILMDMQMPIMDGVTATKEIRKQQQFSDLPIIAMTANAMSSDIDICHQCGMNDHVAKPIDIAELIRKLEHWLPQAGALLPPTQQAIEPTPAHQHPINETQNDIDSIAGINRLGGNEEKYWSLVEKFLLSQLAVCKQLQLTMAQQDSEEVTRQLHTIKGSAANLGLNKLSELAGKLEQSSHSSKVDGHELSQLYNIIYELLQKIGHHHRKDKQPDLNAQQQEQLLLQLREAIEHFDPCANDLLAALEASDITKHQEFHELRSNLADFDFDTAAKSIDQLINVNNC